MDATAASAGAEPGALALVATAYAPGADPREVDPASPPPDGALVWVDVDTRSIAPAELELHAQELCARAGAACPGMTPEMAADLLDPDLWPKLRRYGPGGRIRSVSIVGVEAAEAHGPAGASKAGSLTFQLVELLAGDGWLVTCWHRLRTFHGADEEPVEGELVEHRVHEAVADRWRERRIETAGDIGVCLMEQLAETYPAARRRLYAWVDRWELDFYKRSGEERVDVVERDTLVDMRALIHQFRKSIHQLNAPRDRATTFWFADVTDRPAAERVDVLIARALASLNELADQVRGAFDLVQLQLAQQQGRRTERLQQNVEVVASVLLVPTLIAGMFGANTIFPGANEGWGTVAMLVLMVLGGGGTWLLLRRLRRREEGP